MSTVAAERTAAPRELPQEGSADQAANYRSYVEKDKNKDNALGPRKKSAFYIEDLVYLDGKATRRFAITMVHDDGRNYTYQLRELERKEMYSGGEKFAVGKLRLADYGKNNPRSPKFKKPKPV